MRVRERARAQSRTRRLAYRMCYVVLIASGRAAARLASDFRTLGSFGDRVGVITVVLQVPVLAFWFIVRPISIAAFAACCTLARPPRPGQKSIVNPLQ
jgi:hypothetical protein